MLTSLPFLFLSPPPRERLHVFERHENTCAPTNEETYELLTKCGEDEGGRDNQQKHTRCDEHPS